MKRLTWITRVLGLFAFTLLAGTAFGQGITTSAVSGFVTDSAGNAVSGATVTIVHEPTTTQATTVTRANGQYSVTGLRVGGPYTVSVSGSGYQSVREQNLQLSMDQAVEVNFKLASQVVTMEAFKVTDTRDTTFGAGQVGASTSFTDLEIENVATVRRSVQDVARLDSRLALMSLDQGGQLSAQGQNFRYNSFLIDGVQANDTFGLNSNGFSTLGSPIPLEALQALTVEVNPIDGRRSGFTGALLNGVTKSGTNKFKGSIYYEFTNQDMRAEHPQTGRKDTFKEKTFGATFGGPIIPNRLFFFLSYEDFSRESTPPDQILDIDAAQVQAVAARAKTIGNYDVGSFNPSNEATQEHKIAKLDWNISENHRLSVTYRENEGKLTVFSNFSGTTLTSFSSNWYDAPRLNESYTAQLYSTWTPDLRTEFSVSMAEFDGSPQSLSPSPFPEVTVRGLTGRRRDNNTTSSANDIRFGTEFSRQTNAITTDSFTMAGAADYAWRDHNFVAGFDWENREVVNKFVQATLGSYTFNNLAAWQSGIANSLQLAQLAPGATLDDALARFEIGTFGAFIQDTWKPNDRLSVMGVLRFEQLVMPDAPKDIPNAGTYSEAAFRQAFGRSSTTNPDGNWILAPRFGVNYRFPDMQRKTQLRASVGMFQGRNPTVWLSNAYSNRGVVSRVSQSNVPFTAQTAPASGVGGIPVINVTDPDFVQPVSWKANLALDHVLPFAGLTFTAEVGLIDVYKGLHTVNLNLREAGRLPDGRIRYAGAISPTTGGASRSSASATYRTNDLYQNSNFADVYYLTNTSEGGGMDLTLRVMRPWRNNWMASLAWTRSDFTEVSPLTSSVAQSNFNGRALTNSNENVASDSNTNIDDKIVFMLTKRFEFVKRFPTTASIIYEARAGRPYSWVFFADANGDGFTFNDLLYVPTGPADPK
ncbi:MAG: carboxypeptidase regulatory-like domain-containing protein, partial [Phycisphaerales bacterium]|nr:carboxypeptidase regulatory-like domain-containing protein [Phycisphaerales bacterium]